MSDEHSQAKIKDLVEENSRLKQDNESLHQIVRDHTATIENLRSQITIMQNHLSPKAA